MRVIYPLVYAPWCMNDAQKSGNALLSTIALPTAQWRAKAIWKLVKGSFAVQEERKR